MAEAHNGLSKLEPISMIGFSSSVVNGLKAHPGRQHIIYPIGSIVIVENITTKKQDFLSGHSNTVSCIDVTRSGCLIASGQITFVGFKAEVIIWDFETRQQYCKLVLHRNNVEALAFTYNGKYLITLGGQDDGSVVVWNVAAKDAICGSPAQLASGGLSYCLACASTVDNVFVTAGKDTLRMWEVNFDERKLVATDIRISPYHRVIRCLYVDDDDKYFYCGTTSGDIVMVNMETRRYRGIQPPEKLRYHRGVTAIGHLKTGQYIIGTGDGLVSVCDHLFNRTKTEYKLDSLISSIAMRGEYHQFYVSTTLSNVYRFNNVSDFKPQLVKTCHHDSVNGLTFPENCSQLLVTCGHEDIRVWSVKTCQELVRITVPNITCNSVTVTVDGKSIVSESGKPMYVAKKAYGTMVTAIAAYRNCRFIISGSDIGHVVVWKLPDQVNLKSDEIPHATLHFILKEHKARVTAIRVNKDDSACVTSSIDGSCIIWNLRLRSRSRMMRLNTLFKNVCFHPMEHQLLTAGTDHKVAFWETFDGRMIRELEAALSGSINGIDISPSGEFFVSGGSDKIVKVWRYEEGEVTHVGIGHSAPITGIKISPDQTMIASISSDGAVFIWHFPPAPKPPTADVNPTARDTIEAQLGAQYGDIEHDDVKAVTDEIAERFRC